MGEPNTGRPSVSDSCPQEEELTRDKPPNISILILVLILILILTLILILIREDRERRVLGSP